MPAEGFFPPPSFQSELKSPCVEETIALSPNEEEEDTGPSSLTFLSPNGSENWIPIVPEAGKPCVGMVFHSIDEAFSYYKLYSQRSLFDIRRGSDKRSSDGSIIRKHIYCNKQGKNPKSKLDTMRDGISSRVRQNPSIMSGCMARITVKRYGQQGYIISQFVEAHNHMMATEIGAQFLKSRRKLNFTHQKVVVDLGKINMGPVVAFNVYRSLSGGYNNVGATSRDFLNIQRNIVARIGDYDAQMVIEKFQNKKEGCSSFFFEYFVKDGALTRIFWADPICIRNYLVFGDVVSFDATYSLNKYRLIFVPFTGVDNHFKSVIFGAALISSEDADSYTWVLQAFLKCMKRLPTMVITDQDASLRKVVPVVMPGVSHRFCMWHIMKKMSLKVGFNTPSSQTFRSKLSSIIYDEELEVGEFESAWLETVEKYGFGDNV